MGTMSRTFAHLAEQVSLELLGTPTSRSSGALRWGSKFALIVNTAGARAGTYHDFSTGEHGDLVDLVMRETGLSFHASLTWLQPFSSAALSPMPVAIERSVASPAKLWSNTAQRLWDYGEPLAGTIAEAYLRSRACYVPAARDLRFLPGEKYPPAILARVTDFVTGDPITLHFTQLQPSTGKIGTKFLASHQKRGGVIRLLPTTNTGATLGVAEGLETALSVASRGHVIWAALDAGNLGDLPLKPDTAELNIWSDNDCAGRLAATRLADRYAEGDRVARVLLPKNEGADWNDVVMGMAE